MKSLQGGEKHVLKYWTGVSGVFLKYSGWDNDDQLAPKYARPRNQRCKHYLLRLWWGARRENNLHSIFFSFPMFSLYVFCCLLSIVKDENGCSTSVNSWWLLIVSQAQLQGELFCWKCWHWDCTWTNVDPQNLQCHSLNSVPRTVWSGKYCIPRIQIRSTQGQTALGVPALRQGQFRHNWHPRNDQGAVDTLMDVFTCVKFWSCFRCLPQYTRPRAWTITWQWRELTWAWRMRKSKCLFFH